MTAEARPVVRCLRHPAYLLASCDTCRDVQRIPRPRTSEETRHQ